MKKIFLSAALVAALSIGCYIEYYASESIDAVSALQLENAEALSRDEVGTVIWFSWRKK